MKKLSFYICLFLVVFFSLVFLRIGHAATLVCSDADTYTAAYSASKSEGSFYKDLTGVTSFLGVDVLNPATVQPPFIGIPVIPTTSNDVGAACFISENLHAVLDLTDVFNIVSASPASYPNVFPAIRTTQTGTCRPELNKCYGSTLPTPANQQNPWYCFAVVDRWSMYDATSVMHETCSVVGNNGGNTTWYAVTGAYYIPVKIKSNFTITYAEAKALLNAMPQYKLLYETAGGSLFGNAFSLTDLRQGFKGYDGKVHGSITGDPAVFGDMLKENQDKFTGDISDFADTHFPFNAIKTFLEWVDVFTTTPTAPVVHLAIGNITYEMVSLEKFDDLAAFMRWMVGSYLMLLAFNNLRMLFLGIQGNNERV